MPAAETNGTTRCALAIASGRSVAEEFGLHGVTLADEGQQHRRAGETEDDREVPGAVGRRTRATSGGRRRWVARASEGDLLDCREAPTARPSATLRSRS